MPAEWRHAFARSVHVGRTEVALDEVAYVPWGEWFLPTAHRKNVQGILKFIAPLFWNVSIT